MGVKKYGNDLHGVIVLNKPPGMSSNDALQKAKWAVRANKAGHTGSLDPLATGVLPICFGEATKFSQYLLDSDKAYQSTFRLGIHTSTADAEGEVLAAKKADHLTQTQVLDALAAFKGDIEQVPPMVSAIKKDGKPLYKLARKGVVIERTARPVTVYDIEVSEFRPGDVAELDVTVSCSKGTYIRSLAHDLGEVLGVGGHVSQLNRTVAGPFSLEQSVSLETLEQSGHAEHLLPVETVVHALSSCRLSMPDMQLFIQGKRVKPSEVYPRALQGDKVRVFREDGLFLGVGVLDDVGRVAPKRLVATDQF